MEKAKLWTRPVLSIVFSALALTLSASAQNQNGTLRGVVFDPQGATIANASVRATNENTNASSSTRSGTAQHVSCSNGAG